MNDWQDQGRVEEHGGLAEQFGAEYYRTGLGPIPYDRSQPIWPELFGNMASDLIRVFRPRRVFDAGCAMGFLVEAFWDRGVEAWGRDLSRYAIAEVRSDIRQYCSEGSLSIPLPDKYDLVTCIEVVEHMPETEAISAIVNITSAADQVVFSSSPSDLTESTHINVKPTMYWLKQFAECSFGPIIEVSLPFILPHAIAFERRVSPPTESELIAAAEVIRLRIANARQASDLNGLRAEKVSLRQSAEQLTQQVVELNNQEIMAQTAVSAAEARLIKLESTASELSQELVESQSRESKVRVAALASDDRLKHLEATVSELSQELVESQNRESKARVAALAAEDRVRQLKANAAALSMRHGSTLARLNAKTAELIRLGLILVKQIEELEKRAESAEIKLTRSDALVALHQCFLVTINADETKAQSEIEATKKAMVAASETISEGSLALNEGKAAYDIAIQRLHSADDRIACLERAIEQLHASTSWRATSPLRRLTGSANRAPKQVRSQADMIVPPFPTFSFASPQVEEVPFDFDEEWYIEQNPDVAAARLSAKEHYWLFGRLEGRIYQRPIEEERVEALPANVLFDRDWYLARHSDVAAQGADPLQHFLMHGNDEGRAGNHFAEEDSIHDVIAKAERDRAAAEQRVWSAAGFDRDWYVAYHQDLGSEPDPFAHYLQFGLTEGRPGNQIDLEAGAIRTDDEFALLVEQQAPGELLALFATDGTRLAPEFDREWYTANNKDVKESGGDPELHYVMFGRAEGRAPNGAVAEERRAFRLQDFCNPYEPEVFTPERNPDFLASILTPTYNTPPQFLRELYRSIANQRYGHWEWVVVDDGSSSPSTLAALRDIARSDDRVRLITAERNAGISSATNAALKAARGTHCALVDHDDLLSRDALMYVHREWQKQKDAQIFYTDECKLLSDGSLDYFWAKPAWSPAYLENTMCIGHLTVYEASFLRDLGGFRSEYDGTQDYDLALRASLHRPIVRHIPHFAYLWRVIPGSSAANLSEKSYAIDRQRRAVLDYAHQICPAATVSSGFQAGYWRIRYPLPILPPLLSYIIPTGAGRRVVRGKTLDLITNCIRSFDAKAFYPNREYVVIHNGDLSEEQMTVLNAVPRVKLVHYDAQSFNFSEKLNLGVSHASGEYLCLVNDDVEAITSYGGEEMVSYLVFNPHVGCIGPLCLREDDRIQQNGVVFLPGIGPAHAGDGKVRNFGGHQHRLNCRRESVVIGGAMMVLRRSVFENIGGYDVALPLNYNDVDFGLRLTQSGLSSIVDPGIEVYHFESSTKVGTSSAEQEVLYARGRPMQDPYFSQWFDPSNPNMELLLRPWHRNVVHFGSWLDHEIARRSRSQLPDGRFKFSVCVSVYDQSRALLREMYTSFKMQTYDRRELVLFDNGSSNAETVEWLAEIAAEGVAVLGRSDENLGIMGANRELLKLVSGDFLVAMDADDFITADALQVLAVAAEGNPTSKIFYTDEYKSDPTSVRFAPFFKPDFDPVLLMNCCYPAHLMAISVELLQAINAYADDRATWCHDWDTLTRGMMMGEEPHHVRALTYAWRINPGSTASAETGTKPGTAASQKFVLERFLAERGLAPALRVEPNTIETSSGMWRLATDEPVTGVKVLDAGSIWGEHGSGLPALRSAVGSSESAWVAILTEGDSASALLALSAVARLDDRICVVSGLVLEGETGTMKWSGGLFAPGGVILDPYAGHRMAEGGYHGQMWCQRCVDVAAPVNVLLRVEVLREALADLDDAAGADRLMTRLGLLAQTKGAFVAVTPHLLCTQADARTCPLPIDRNGILSGDTNLSRGGRWYNSNLSIDRPYEIQAQ